MKKILLLLGLLLVLGLAYLYLGKAESKKLQEVSGIDLSDRAFAVEKEKDIHKIVITTKTHPKYTIIKQDDDSWMFNEYFKADRHVMMRLLEALTKIDIKYIPPEPSQKTIAKNMARTGIEVQVYDKTGNKLRDFIVGSNANDERSTFFKVKGKDKAYAMYFPYSEGSLRTRFVYDLMDLRDKYILEEDISAIQSVEVIYPKQAKHSFLLEKKEKDWSVQPLHADIEPSKKQLNNQSIEDFLSVFKLIPSENIETHNPRIDSINSVTPFMSIKITNTEGVVKSLKLRPMNDFLDEDQNTTSVDEVHIVERFFVETNWRDSYLLQKRHILGALRPYNYFYRD